MNEPTDNAKAIHNEIENAQSVLTLWEMGDITSHEVASRLEAFVAKLRALPCDEVTYDETCGDCGKPITSCECEAPLK